MQKKRLNIGDKVGNLTVIEYVGVIDSNTCWKFKCDCGNEVVKSETIVLCGHIQHCNYSCPYLHDISGQTFGLWTVIEPKKFDKPPRTRWLCKCKCGNERYVSYHDLTKGNSKSCGCVVKEKRIKSCTKHNLSHHPLSYILAQMKQRCYNPNNNRYINYGARGIKVCDEWLLKNGLGLKNFFEWSINNGYKEGLTIDRIDVNKDYEPSNCRWITNKNQQYNKTVTIYLTYNNETHNIKEWSDILGLPTSLIVSRLKRKWDVEKIFNTPLDVTKSHKKNT